MFTKLRKRLHLTPATVIATLALLFAMSGGAAYAASHYLITSTKQIKPSVLKKLEGKNGKNGATGAAGPAGAAGPTGPQGPAGTAGAKGEDGTNGTNGESVTVGAAGASECNGEGGATVSNTGGNETVCNGKTGFTDTLPSGRVETGAWSLTVKAQDETTSVYIPLSFPIPMKSEEFKTETPMFSENQVHFFAEGEVATAGSGCGTGSGAKPEAEPGNVCVWATIGGINGVSITSSDVTFKDPSFPKGELGAGATGALMDIVIPTGFVSGTSSEVAAGTWAVSAP